jgi:hypothetical protein
MITNEQWKTIAAEFKSSIQNYLCHGSPTFRNLWNNYDFSFSVYAHKKAKEFRKSIKRNIPAIAAEGDYDSPLFYHKKDPLRDKERKTRLKFLRWILKNND